MLTLSLNLGEVTHARNKGGGAAAFASFAAPAGFRWDFVTLNGQRVALNGEPVVTLVEA